MHVHKILLIGRSCVGKGATFKQLSGYYGDELAIIGTGDEVRKRMNSDTEFRAIVLPYVERGELIPDPIIIHLGLELVDQATADPLAKIHGYDGFPRNAKQFNVLLKKGIIHPETTQAIILNASQQTCWNRVLHRAVNRPNGRRPDEDNYERMKDAFERKMRVYDKETPLLQGRLAKEGFRTHIINADREILEFTTDALAVAKAMRPSRAETSSTATHSDTQPGISMSERFARFRANKKQAPGFVQTQAHSLTA